MRGINMAYTVKKLAKLSGISVRTLHHYDALGLLKPAYYGDNNYRYYEEEQLLLLQQILFYRELGFQLSEIQKILKSEDFDKIEALKSHRKFLENSINQTKNLVKTVDKTIAHLRGKEIMKDEEFYYGFDSEKQKEHEKYLVDQGIVTKEFIDECNAKVKNWSNKEKNDFIKDIDRIMDALVEALEKDSSTDEDKVQDLMNQHYVWLSRSWNPTKQRYLGLADLYKTPDFRKFYDERHPELLDFMIQAMSVYADSNLKDEDEAE